MLSVLFGKWTHSLNVLVTGATGFIGRRLVESLNFYSSRNLTLAVRFVSQCFVESKFQVPCLDSNTDWYIALAGQSIIIHPAARAHTMKDEMTDPLAEYRRVNIDGTLNLARQAAAAGVKRFIFTSSIGVNGNISKHPFTENDSPNPTELFAHLKLEAEDGLWEIQRATGMEIVIIRLPLVYGPNAPGNFGSFVSWIEKGRPLSLGSVNNKRALEALDNLVDLNITCIDHPAAANQIFLAGDGEDISTTELLQGVARAMDKLSRLIPVPSLALTYAASILGKKALAQHLIGSLQIDIGKACELLGWTLPLSVEKGLRSCFVDNSERY